MKYSFCPDCGERLTEKNIGDEGMTRWCEKCSRPWFDGFYTCILAAVVNELGEVALIRQGYVSTEYCVGVAGHIKCGETAEAAAAREVEEEIGLVPESVEFIQSSWYEKKGMLMLGFRVNVKKAELKPSCEVDSADWYSPEKAMQVLRPGSNIQRLVAAAVDCHENEVCAK